MNPRRRPGGGYPELDSRAKAKDQLFMSLRTLFLVDVAFRLLGGASVRDRRFPSQLRNKPLSGVNVTFTKIKASLLTCKPEDLEQTK